MLEAIGVGFLTALMFVAVPGAALAFLVGFILRQTRPQRRWPWRVMAIVWGSLMLLATAGAAVGLSAMSVH